MLLLKLKRLYVGGQAEACYLRGWSKRLFDIVASSLAIACLLPLFLLIGLLIKLDSSGPVFYTQVRTGLRMRPFRIWKFRSMTHTSSEAAFIQARRSDPRTTRVGVFIRRTSLDELPQLFNVIVGDMSLVGPRPHPPELDKAFAGKIEGFDERYSVKPGITGLAQTCGARGETIRVDQMRRRVELDLEYIGTASFSGDLRAIIRTVVEVFGSRTAF